MNFYKLEFYYFKIMKKEDFQNINDTTQIDLVFIPQTL
jgi:hypothetical protein